MFQYNFKGTANVGDSGEAEVNLLKPLKRGLGFPMLVVHPAWRSLGEGGGID
jgi:hypothetical protein